MMRLAVLWLSLAAGAAPTPLPSVDPRAEQYWREFCSVLRGCGLTPSAGACSEAQSAGVDGVRYDEERCREPRTLAARGVAAGGSVGTRLYRFLGRRYRVVYPLQGQLPLSAARLSFLLDDLPLATRLLAHYQKVPYAAEYAEGGRIRARRGESLTADGHLISGGTAERTLYYFGSGVSHLGPWKLSGLALLHLEYWPSGATLGYRVRIVSAPANAFLNTVMNLGLFRRVLRSRVDEVLTDISEAGRKLQEDQGRSLAAAGFTAQERLKIEAFLKLP